MCIFQIACSQNTDLVHILQELCKFRKASHIEIIEETSEDKSHFVESWRRHPRVLIELSLFIDPCLCGSRSPIVSVLYAIYQMICKHVRTSSHFLFLFCVYRRFPCRSPIILFGKFTNDTLSRAHVHLIYLYVRFERMDSHQGCLR